MLAKNAQWRCSPDGRHGSSYTLWRHCKCLSHLSQVVLLTVHHPNPIPLDRGGGQCCCTQTHVHPSGLPLVLVPMDQTNHQPKIRQHAWDYLHRHLAPCLTPYATVEYIVNLSEYWWNCFARLTFRKRLSRSSGSVWVSINRFKAGICLQSSSYARNKRLSLVLRPQSKIFSRIRHLLICELFYLPSFLKISSSIPLCNEIPRRMEHVDHTAKTTAHWYLRCGQSSKSTVSILSPIRDIHSLTFWTLIVLLQLELRGPHTFASIQRRFLVQGSWFRNAKTCLGRLCRTEHHPLIMASEWTIRSGYSAQVGLTVLKMDDATADTHPLGASSCWLKQVNQEGSIRIF